MNNKSNFEVISPRLAYELGFYRGEVFADYHQMIGSDMPECFDNESNTRDSEVFLAVKRHLDLQEKDIVSDLWIAFEQGVEDAVVGSYSDTVEVIELDDSEGSEEEL